MTVHLANYCSVAPFATRGSLLSERIAPTGVESVLSEHLHRILMTLTLGLSHEEIYVLFTLYCSWLTALIKVNDRSSLTHIYHHPSSI